MAMAKNPTAKLVDAAEYAKIQLETMQGMYAADLGEKRRAQLGGKGKDLEFQIDNKRQIKMLERALAPFQRLIAKKRKGRR